MSVVPRKFKNLYILTHVNESSASELEFQDGMGWDLHPKFRNTVEKNRKGKETHVQKNLPIFV